jgi:hypothetical protein
VGDGTAATAGSICPDPVAATRWSAREINERPGSCIAEPVEGFSDRIEHFFASRGLVSWNHAPRFRKGRMTGREDSCGLGRGQAATRAIERASPSRQKDRSRNCCVWLASMKAVDSRTSETDPGLRDSSGWRLDCDTIARGDGHQLSGFRHARRGGRVQLGKHDCCVGAAGECHIRCLSSNRLMSMKVRAFVDHLAR